MTGFLIARDASYQYSCLFVHIPVDRNVKLLCLSVLLRLLRANDSPIIRA